MRAVRAITVLFCATALVVCMRAPAAGQDDEKAPPCLGDVKRLCGLVPPAGPFVQECLEARWGQLSPECRKHVDDLTKDAIELATACRGDLARFCPYAGQWAGGRATCLVDHRNDLSAKCKKELDAKSAN